MSNEVSKKDIGKYCLFWSYKNNLSTAPILAKLVNVEKKMHPVLCNTRVIYTADRAKSASILTRDNPYDFEYEYCVIFDGEVPKEHLEARLKK